MIFFFLGGGGGGLLFLSAGCARKHCNHCGYFESFQCQSLISDSVYKTPSVFACAFNFTSFCHFTVFSDLYSRSSLQCPQLKVKIVFFVVFFFL